MTHFFIDEDGTEVRIEGTKEDLDTELRRVGLVGDDEKQYNTMREFLDENEIRVFTKVVKMEVLSVSEIVDRWK